ncbi:MAG: phosphatase PAP2 family protein [Cucumibacter sp.]
MVETPGWKWPEGLAGAGAGRWRRWALIALAALALFVLTALVFDAPVTRALMAWPDDERAFFRWLTGWGESGWILVPAFIVWAGTVALTRFRRLAFAARWAAKSFGAMAGLVFLSVGVPGLLAAILKRLIGRARPTQLDELGTLWFQPIQPFDWTMQALPSGHATTSFALAVALVALFGRRLRFVYAIAALIALSRIVTGAHYLSDSIAGAVLGTLVAFLVRDWFAGRRWVIERRDGSIRNRMLAPIRRYWRRLTRQDAAR